MIPKSFSGAEERRTAFWHPKRAEKNARPNRKEPKEETERERETDGEIERKVKTRETEQEEIERKMIHLRRVILPKNDDASPLIHEEAKRKLKETNLTCSLHTDSAFISFGVRSSPI